MVTVRSRTAIGAVLCAVFVGYFWLDGGFGGAPRAPVSEGERAESAPPATEGTPLPTAERLRADAPGSAGGEAVAGPSQARLVFLSTRDAQALPRLPVHLQREQAGVLARETDARGGITVPAGRWQLSLETERYGLRQDVVDAVAEQQQVLWASPVTNIGVRIQDPGGQPIGGACVTLAREEGGARPSP